MAGGAIGRGVIVDLSRWKEIGPIDSESRTVVVGPGAICADVVAAASRAGLRLPVTPSSAAFCTIGGMVATNAAGAQSLAFGSMRDWVRGVECFYADGTNEWIRRGEQPMAGGRGSAALALLSESAAVSKLTAGRHRGVLKDSSGYGAAAFVASGDLLDLLAGSEGTLAFFTAIEVALAPLPGAVASVMGEFPTLEAATAAATQAGKAGATACELLDRTFLELVSEASGHAIAPGAAAILLADVEGSTTATAQAGCRAVAGMFTSAGAMTTRIAESEAARESLWRLRHAASPILARLSDRLKSMQFIEDGAVPPDRLGEYVAGIRAALDRQGIRGVIFGHAGEGHVHVNPLVDVTASDWRRRVEALLDEVTGLVASLGGTVSGEHGDGRVRSGLLPRVWTSEALAGFAAIKQAFDPDGLLNPGVKTSADENLGAIKYDPALEPLPAAASRALRKVETSRAYARFRLELLGES
jgi:FAD/FMN-containing dehydrogenase